MKLCCIVRQVFSSASEEIVILNRLGERGHDWSHSEYGQVTCFFCKRGNELAGFTKCEKFVNELRKYQLLKKDFAAWRWLVGWLVNLCDSTCTTIDRDNYNIMQLINKDMVQNTINNNAVPSVTYNVNQPLNK